MPIIHQPKAYQFIYITDSGQQGGKLMYRYLSQDKIDVFHTKVDSALQGKGIAGELYNALMEFVQQKQLKIKPSCSYIEKKIMRSHSEWIG